MKTHQGFTMIELLMVLVILSIITAFAVPSYQEYVRKKDRAVAQQEMQKLAMELERFRGKNFTYAGFSSATEAYDVSSGTLTVPLNVNEDKKTYTITITNGDGQPLTNGADGFTWRMYAERIDEAAQALNYDLLMTSGGIRCMTRTSGVVNGGSCGDNQEIW